MKKLKKSRHAACSARIRALFLNGKCRQNLGGSRVYTQPFAVQHFNLERFGG